MSINKLVSSAIWSLAGQLAPLIVAVITLPPLIRVLGIDRYGFLSLALVLIGYAGLFDFGVSRAMTRLVAERISLSDFVGAKRVGSVAISYMAMLGVFSGILLGLFSHVIINHWLAVPQAIDDEATHAMWLLAASMPFVLITSSYRGYIEAYQHFKPLNVVRMLLGAFTYIGPLLAALISPRLDLVVGALVATRFIATIAHARVATRHCDFRYAFALPDPKVSRTLFSLGGWMTVSNIVSPIMTTMDRFVLGGIVSVEFVAYYATPYDLMNRVMIIPYALMAALFPIIAGLATDAQGVRETYQAVIRLIFVLIFPIVFVTITLGGGFLHIWLGETFAQHGTIVMQILSLGVLANSLAQAPANLIHALGKPKWMAITHVIELPLFLLGIWYFTNRFGIAGTAFTWTIRAVVDSIVLFILANYSLPYSKIRLRPFLLPFGVTTALIVAAFAVPSMVQSVWLCVLGLSAFGVFAWHNVLTRSDKGYLVGFLSSATQRSRAMGDGK